MRRPRVRIWMMMVGVAVTALVLWMLERQARFSVKARDHAARLGVYIVSFAPYEFSAQGFVPLDSMLSTSEKRMSIRVGQAQLRYLDRRRQLVPEPDGSRAVQDWHRRMKAKYDCAARYPWLPVERDPLKPK
jgi:hypothetical protein